MMLKLLNSENPCFVIPDLIRNPVISICSGYRRSPVWRYLDFLRNHQIFNIQYLL